MKKIILKVFLILLISEFLLYMNVASFAEDEDMGFDLSLQTYITSIYSKGENKAKKSEPTIDTKDFAEGTQSDVTYLQDKEPIQAYFEDYVIYTFTVYNEGNVDGYVNKIKTNIPKGLQFIYIAEDGQTLISCDSEGNSEIIEVDNNVYELINKHNTYWLLDSNETGLLKETYNGEENISITCDVDSYIGEKRLLKAFDKSQDEEYNGKSLDRLSVSVVLKVVAEDKSGAVIKNEAKIVDAEDVNGNTQASDKQADDGDYENIILEDSDLKATKFITAVSDNFQIEDGEYLSKDKKKGSKDNPYLRQTIVNTTNLRDDENCHDAEYSDVSIDLEVPERSYVLYNIRIYNEGNTAGFAGKITDYLPEYLDYVYCDFNDNFYRWELGGDGKTITTDYLSFEQDKENNLIKPFDKNSDDGQGSGLDYRDVQVLCRVNNQIPVSVKLTNDIEITKCQDKYGAETNKGASDGSDQIMIVTME